MAAKPSSRNKDVSTALYNQITIADAVSMLSILAGFSAMLLSLNGKFGTAAACIVVGVVLDSIDGMLARKLKITHDLGAQLDSLADFCTFGLAPAVLLYAKFSPEMPGIIFPLGIFVLCGALRLARFNTLHLTDLYLGIPITSNGIFFPMLLDLGASPAIIVALLILSAALMVSSFRIPKHRIRIAAGVLILAWAVLHFLR